PGLLRDELAQAHRRVRLVVAELVRLARADERVDVEVERGLDGGPEGGLDLCGDRLHELRLRVSGPGPCRGSSRRGYALAPEAPWRSRPGISGPVGREPTMVASKRMRTNDPGGGAVVPEAVR